MIKKYYFCKRLELINMKRSAITIIFCSLIFTINAQTISIDDRSSNISFNHLDLGITLGTTGIGIEASTPICDIAQLRAGFAFMPHINYDMNFDIQVGDDPSQSHSKFEKLSGFLEQLTGNKVNESVIMEGHPSYNNVKLLIDVFPFRNKHWHLTAGFFYGKSEIASAINSMEDMQSLTAVNIYNNIYNKAYRDMKSEPTPIIKYGDDEIFLDPDMEEKILSYGRMGIHIGDYKNYFKDKVDKDGNVVLDEEGNAIKVPVNYIMEPDINSIVKARIKTNKFKPYIGFGYGGNLSKYSDKYKILFDCGLMFWGGTPDVLTHDGTNLTKDLVNVRGKVGTYVNIINKFKAFPVIDLRITKRLF